MILDLLGLDQSRIKYVGERLGHDFRYAINASKIKSLGWQPKHDFKTWLQKTVNWSVVETTT